MRELSCMRIISKVATLAAIAYKTSIGTTSPIQQSPRFQCKSVAISDHVLKGSSYWNLPPGLVARHFQSMCCWEQRLPGTHLAAFILTLT